MVHCLTKWVEKLNNKSFALVVSVKFSELTQHSSSNLFTYHSLHFCFVDPLGMAMLHVFSFLSAQDRCQAGKVCRLWREVSLHPAAWRELSLVDILAGSKVVHFYKVALLLLFILLSHGCCA